MLLVFFNIASPASAFKGSVCDLGTVPGRFDYGQFPSWKIFNKSCALADLFTPLLATDKSKWSLGVHNIDRRQQENVKILLFGDSVEQHLLADVCAHFVENAKNILSVKDSHAKRCGNMNGNVVRVLLRDSFSLESLPMEFCPSTALREVRET